MEYLYPFLIAFLFVFISELGDKTQLLVLSFSSKVKTASILFGVALGSFFSHGLAILFGSSIGLLENETLHSALEFITFTSFILFGMLTFLPSKKTEKTSSHKNLLLQKLSRFGIGYVLFIAFSICIGELGDKTFLASIGLGINYPYYKISLVIGAILGMVVSDSIAILFGKFLSHRVSEGFMQKLSGVLFLLFGLFGMVQFFVS